MEKVKCIIESGVVEAEILDYVDDVIKVIYFDPALNDFVTMWVHRNYLTSMDITL